MAYSYDPTTSIDPFFHSLGSLDSGLVQRGGSILSQSLVLNCEKGEIVKAPIHPSKKRVSEEKALAALRNHSEAERRRRQRINSHLTTLRGLVPCLVKRDKATLLAEVVSQVKEMKKKASEASNGVFVPMDTDEVKVEPCGIEVNGYMSFKATLCCEYRPELLSDLKQTLDSFHLKLLKAEISTLGARVKNAFFFTSSIAENGDHSDASRHLASSVRQAISFVLEKASSPEYSPRTTLSTKRRRLSSFDTSSSSSGS
ncbi:putative transcription factor bHLH107 [Momordica charantia]|uniref:Transcription factor bHLH107 n=1 Tax=Momordica charantia TaxID=3673 RepID=A0A6J1CDE7_MOMCH|nr:putative transcription factor bHLH107 [Momordica charantia]